MRVEVLEGAERRRRWSHDEKMRIVAETLQPGVKVTTVTLAAITAVFTIDHVAEIGEPHCSHSPKHDPTGPAAPTLS